MHVCIDASYIHPSIHPSTAGYPLIFNTIPFNSVISYRGNFSFLLSVVYLYVYHVTLFPCHFPHVWRKTLRYICFACYFYIKKFIYWKDSYLPSRNLLPDDSHVFPLTFVFSCNLCYLHSFTRFIMKYFISFYFSFITW